MANTKGGSFATVRAFVAERYGAPGWDETCELLSAVDRVELDAMLPVGWYPSSLYARLIRAVDEAHGCGDLALVVQLGRYAADREGAAIQRAFARLPNPSYAASRIGEHWRRFHDHGDWQLERISDAQIAGVLASPGYVDHAICRETGGYIGRLLELLGAKYVLLEHPQCRAHGDAECFFQGRWGGVRNAPQPSALPSSRPRGEPVSGPIAVAAAIAVASTSREAFSASIDALVGRAALSTPAVPNDSRLLADGGSTAQPHAGLHATKPAGDARDPRKRAGGR